MPWLPSKAPAVAQMPAEGWRCEEGQQEQYALFRSACTALGSIVRGRLHGRHWIEAHLTVARLLWRSALEAPVLACQPAKHMRCAPAG